MSMYNLRSRKLDLFNPKSFENNSYEFEEEVQEESQEEVQEESSSSREDSSISEDRTNPLFELFKKVSEREQNEDEWKSELEEEEILELEPKLEEIRLKIKESVPTIPNILRSNLFQEDKVYSIKLYDEMIQCAPNTPEYLSLSSRINAILDSVDERLSSSSSQLDLLRKKINIDVPTFSKILDAKITEKDKLKALVLFDSLRYKYFGSDEWNETVSQIDLMIKSEFDSQEELFIAQQSEAELDNVKVTSSLKRRIFDLDADIPIKKRIHDMYEEMSSRESHDSIYSELKNKIQLSIQLPYNKVINHFENISPEEIGKYLSEVYERLNSEIYGMKDVKEKIIQVLNNRISNPNSGAVLALKGKPGLGKTKLAQAVAKATGLPFDKISLGGSIDPTIFKGSSSVWSGASPSLLLKILSRLKYSNGIVLLDEVDKLGDTDKGIEVQNSLLHVLDPSQNKKFQDLFLDEFDHDISRVWFILSMNDDVLLNPALKDRLDIIEIQEYTVEETIEIIRKFTLPRSLEDKGIKKDLIDITPEACRKLLSLCSDKNGLRSVERAINDIVSKLNLLNSIGKEKSVPLSFKLKHFNGFPFTINCDDIEILFVPPKSKHLSYFN